MAAELGLLSLTQLQEFAQFRQQQQQSQPYMWNPNHIIPQDQDDDSWEVRAFEQDSSNVTWPPRSYSCTFCTREFRSAQALGGHMNVHRRDRARLHQAPPLPGVKIPTTNTNSDTTFLIPSQEIVTNGGLCFVYSLPNNPIGNVSNMSIGLNNFIKPPPSNFATIDSNNINNLFPSCPPIYNSRPFKLFPEPSTISRSEININIDSNGRKKNSLAIEELDLELRLGPR